MASICLRCSGVLLAIACCIWAEADAIWAVRSRPSTTCRMGFTCHRPGFRLELCAKTLPLRTIRIAIVHCFMRASCEQSVSMDYVPNVSLAGVSGGRNAQHSHGRTPELGNRGFTPAFLIRRHLFG